MFIVSSSLYSASVFFPPRCWIRMDGEGWSSVSVRSDAACMNGSADDRLVGFVRYGKSYVLLENCSDAVLRV